MFKCVCGHCLHSYAIIGQIRDECEAGALWGGWAINMRGLESETNTAAPRPRQMSPQTDSATPRPRQVSPQDVASDILSIFVSSGTRILDMVESGKGT